MTKIFLLVIGFAAGIMFFNSCSATSTDSAGAGANTSRTSGTFTYSTTSNVGDYAEWTFDGTTITATWQVINSTGGVDMTFNVNATCGTFNSTYGYYTCAVNSGSSCTDGLVSCSGSPSGSFEMMEVPDTAIFVHTSGGGDQLHVGILKDANACSANVAGDYVYVRTDMGGNELFGAYNTDSNFINVVHADFEMINTTSSTTDPTLNYRTTDGATVSGDGTLAFGNSGCTGGVRTRTHSGGTLRAMLTTSGLFILDLPSGQGGLVSFKTANAAALSDLANKTFGGISFPDNGSPQPLRVVTGASSGGAVTITSGDSGGNPISGADLRALSNATSALTAPAFPNFAGVPVAGPHAYSLNSLSGNPSFATPSAFPGMFRVDGSMGGDTGRVMLAAAKLNNKVVGFGFTYNFRANGATNPKGGTYSAGVYNTGNFIIFERD